jgi:hypothetical protein
MTYPLFDFVDVRAALANVKVPETNLFNCNSDKRRWLISSQGLLLQPENIGFQTDQLTLKQICARRTERYQ